MGRSPLDPAATAAADDAFYSAHPELVVNGVRQPLSGTDPSHAALRDKWWSHYDAEAAKEEREDENSKPANPVKDCPDNDWITVKLMHEGGSEPYAAEHFSATNSAGKDESGTLASGERTWNGVPCGSYSIRFDRFFTEISEFIEQELR